MNQKGMGVGQVFVYITVVLTFALIMIFGYKAINDFLGGAEDVGFVQFKNDLERAVKQIYTEDGSVREAKFRPPAKYTQICFIDLDYSQEKIEAEKGALCAEDVIACSFWEEAPLDDGNEIVGYKKIDQNVFLQPEAPAIKVYKISLTNADGTEQRGFLCVKIRDGILNLRLEGKGDHTQLSEVIPPS